MREEESEKRKVRVQEVIGSVVNGVKGVIKEEFKKCVIEWTKARNKGKKRTNTVEGSDSELKNNMGKQENRARENKDIRETNVPGKLTRQF